ncbi:unnamed protein product, partial [Prorocentrum cordatum]
MVQVMKKTKVKAAAKAPAVRGKPKAKATVIKKPASAGDGATWSCEQLASAAAACTSIEEKQDLFKAHADVSDPAHLKCIFTDKEIRALYGRFETARKKKPKAAAAYEE